MQRSFVIVLLLLGVGLLLVGPVSAQTAATPEPVGLRPDAPQYALHGPYWVGTKEFVVGDFPTGARFWYPALNPDNLAEDMVYEWTPGGPTMAGHAIEDAAPNTEDGPYPLVIFIHGWNDIRIQSIYLAEHLASQGFVVASTDYADSWFNDNKVFHTGLYTRPTHASKLIDYSMQLSGERGALEGLIDPEKVAAMGHSFGGTNALSLAGAPIDLDWVAQVAAEHPEACLSGSPDLGETDTCAEALEDPELLARVARLDAVPEGLWPAWSDVRVDAIVPLAPAGLVFSPQSLGGVTVPTMLMTGSADTYVEPNFNVLRLYPELPSGQKALVILDGASHHVFRDACKDTQWLADMGFFYACSDFVWDMDRAHDLINHFTTAFLLSTLKGDAEATAALAPDAVAFPGIEYQAEGF